MSSILQKNELENVDFCRSLLGQNFFVRFWRIEKTKEQCWAVGAIFTFGRSRMFGHEKLRPSAVDRSRSRRINNCKTCVIKVLISNHSN